jgi:hypothetical protein
VTTRATDLLLAQGDHASRPASAAKGALYPCTTHGLVYQWDGTTWVNWALVLPAGSTSGQVPVWDAVTGLWVPGAGGTGGGITPGRTKAKRTAGNVTLNSTTFVNIDTGIDLTIAAAAGDTLEVTMSVRADAGSGPYCVLDFHTIVGGSPVNSVAAEAAAGTTNVGFPGWSTGNVRASTNGYTHFSATKQYTVQAGDISGGNVTLRLRGFSGGSVTLAASDPYLYVAVVNLKQ